MNAAAILTRILSLEILTVDAIRPNSVTSAAPTSRVSPYLTLEEAAAYARCHPRTVRRWIAAGTLPFIKSGRTLVHIDDLEAAMRRIPSGTA